MSYMNTHAAFAPASGIQELSFDEIAYVGAGAGKGPTRPKSRSNKIRDAGRKAAKMIPGKKDDWAFFLATEAAAGVVDFVEWATSDE